jgi:hypothetical protein
MFKRWTVGDNVKALFVFLALDFSLPYMVCNQIDDPQGSFTAIVSSLVTKPATVVEVDAEDEQVVAVKAIPSEEKKDVPLVLGSVPQYQYEFC